jgi:fatty acid synthase
VSLQHIRSRLAPGAPFSLLGYSFGALLALELALELEAEGREGHLHLVDGSPGFTKSLLKVTMGSDDEQFETNLICTFYSIVASHEATSEAVNKVFHVQNFLNLLCFEEYHLLGYDAV